ncbi:MAG: ATP-binding protein [Prevotellaceae bacterium]|jgi:NadR type nicotinamide-nucleotide adenylyltransferase|nr:ATP-binding protein [Prevotellaceae bacterium]
MYKIAVVGPESTGKTALTQSLANYYRSVRIPEYAREYVEKLNRRYNYQDIERIAKKQIEQEQGVESQENNCKFVFFDTDLIITKVWFEYCYRKVPEYVEERLKTGFFDLYLLCYPDLEWKPDPVREHGGDDRIYFFYRYENEIAKLKKPFVYIQGHGICRLNSAINGIEEYINNK